MQWACLVGGVDVLPNVGRSSTHEMNDVFPAFHLPIASLVMSKLELGSVLQRRPRESAGRKQWLRSKIVCFRYK